MIVTVKVNNAYDLFGNKVTAADFCRSGNKDKFRLMCSSPVCNCWEAASGVWKPALNLFITLHKD